MERNDNATPEAGSNQDPAGSEPELPAELAAFLRESEPYASLLYATNYGTAILAKLPSFEIASIRGVVPMHLGHFLYSCPTAPVIRSVLTIFDKPSSPLALETFINVADRQQRDDFASLGRQDALYLHCYDEQLTKRLSKRIGGFPQPEVLTLIDGAIDLLQTLPRGRFDFDAAKATVIRATMF